MTDLSRDRLGVLTCSELHRVLRQDGKLRSGDGPQTYLREKLAEWWLGRPLRAWTGSGGPAEQGTILEAEALPWYEFEHGITLVRPGFCMSGDGLLGGTVDSLGVEIKCPQPVKHLEYLLAGELPSEYDWQVQGYMYVWERPSWTFVSYSRQFPKLVLTVERDDEKQSAIRAAGEWWRKQTASLRGLLQQLADSNGLGRPALEREAHQRRMAEELKDQEVYW